jgi:hypothetical protein
MHVAPLRPQVLNTKHIGASPPASSTHVCLYTQSINVHHNHYEVLVLTVSKLKGDMALGVEVGQ